MPNPESDWRGSAAEALRRLALNEGAKAYILEHPELYRPLYLAAERFIGGDTLEACIESAASINAAGHALTIDFMGESVRDAAQAAAAREEFLRVIAVIVERGLNASVSLDLSHLGLLIDRQRCLDNASAVAHAAADAGLEVMISAEGPERTDAVLELHGVLNRACENVGITLQAYLKRTATDIASILDRPTKIRIVKGAYSATDPRTLSRGPELDDAYRTFASQIAAAGNSLSIATHDSSLIDTLVAEAAGRGEIEIEMLKGICPDILAAYRAAGHRTRVYLPYGRQWHLYLCNRLAEFPENVFQAIAEAIG